MASVTATGKIIPAPIGEPNAAKPPPSHVPGGAIEAAAAKTDAAVAEAAAAHTVLAGSGMSGGAVEVRVPGPTMPTGGDGPSFANTYVGAVEGLHQLQSDGGADALHSAPAEIVPLIRGGGLAFEPEPTMPIDKTGGARIGRHWRTPQSRYHSAELAKGIKMEMEHTDSHTIALEIAKDHLSELPDYYSRLERMEKRAFAERKKKGPKTRKHGRSDKRTRRRRHR